MKGGLEPDMGLGQDATLVETRLKIRLTRGQVYHTPEVEKRRRPSARPMPLGVRLRPGSPKAPGGLAGSVRGPGVAGAGLLSGGAGGGTPFVDQGGDEGRPARLV